MTALRAAIGGRRSPSPTISQTAGGSGRFKAVTCGEGFVRGDDHRWMFSPGAKSDWPFSPRPHGMAEPSSSRSTCHRRSADQARSRILDGRRGRRHHHHDSAAILPGRNTELVIELSHDGQQPDPIPLEPRLVHREAGRLGGLVDAVDQRGVERFGQPRHYLRAE
jgi:hypothetical protein